MKRSIVLVAAIIAMGMFTVAASAQQQGRAGRQGGPGTMQRGGARGMSIVQVLGNKDVQNEIKVTTEQKEQLREIAQAARSQFDRAALANLSQEERQAKMRELRAKMVEQQKELETKIATILKPAQMKRVEQIRLQAMGPMAIRSPEVAEKLKLTEDQKTQMGEALRAAMTKMRESSTAGTRPGPEAMKKMRDSMEAAAMGALTDSQKETWKEMIGTPFDTSKLRQAGMTGGGRAGQQGRPGAARGQGRPGKARPGKGRPGQGGGNG